jgi:hypothetical protein
LPLIASILGPKARPVKRPLGALPETKKPARGRLFRLRKAPKIGWPGSGGHPRKNEDIKDRIENTKTMVKMLRIRSMK